MCQMEPTLRRLYRVRTLAVLAFLDGMVVTMVDYLLILDDHMLHAVHKCPANATSVTGVDESVLRTCVEGIFTVHKLRMKDYITLLRR